MFSLRFMTASGILLYLIGLGCIIFFHLNSDGTNSIVLWRDKVMAWGLRLD